MEVIYQYKPLSSSIVNNSDEYGLFDIPRDLGVKLAILLSYTPLLRHSDMSAIAELQWRLLLDASTKIVREIRAMRDGLATSIDDAAQEDAYAVTATSLLDVKNAVLNAQTGALDDEILAELVAIAATL